MANAKNQTVENTNNVTDFINSVPDETKRADSFRIIEMMKAESGFEPKMWGPAIIGFGSCHYKYESGREGDMPRIGFSPRKNNISLYLALNKDDRAELLKDFGKHKISVACIYIKRLDDISIPVFKKMIKVSLERVRSKYG